MKQSATVYWFDSTILTFDGTFTQEEVESTQLSNMMSSGIIAYENEQHIVLAKDYNSTSTNAYRGVSLIPKCNVIKIIRHRNS